MIIGEINIEGYETIHEALPLNKEVIYHSGKDKTLIGNYNHEDVDLTTLKRDIAFNTCGIFKKDLLVLFISQEEKHTKTYIDLVDNYKEFIDVLIVII